jgi:phosphatidylinositol glycan class Z
MYDIPQSLLILPSTSILYVNPETKQKYKKSRKFFLYEYGSLDLDMLYKKVKIVLDAALMREATSKHKFQLYLAISSSKIDELNFVFYKNSNNSVVTYKEIKTFYPHFSGEALPNIYARHPCELNTDVGEIDDTCSIDEYYDNYDNLYSVKSLSRRFSSLIHQFGVTIYKIDVRKPKRKG